MAGGPPLAAWVRMTKKYRAALAVLNDSGALAVRAALDDLKTAIQENDRCAAAARHAAQLAVQQALTRLDSALPLVSAPRAVRISDGPEDADLEPWMQQAHDSTPR